METRMVSGTRIAQYEIGTLLGTGGMGEVYRARDTRLGRDVAVKILPAEFTSDPDRLARFEREARLLASLNHPNIATIHATEEADGLHAIVMELVEGETVADRIARAGALPEGEALAIARQIADALDAAHEKGIVHRDLKPANIKLTPQGTVKVLDFGLAKMIAASGTDPMTSRTATVTVDATREGHIVGTAAYMSPEQARGLAVDKRTDVWAFGCVLYEMFTGRAAFARRTVTDTLAAIVEGGPDSAALAAIHSPAVRHVIGRCLEKDVRRRLRDVADARSELDDVVLTPGTRRRTRWLWPVAAALILAAGLAAIWRMRSDAATDTEAAMRTIAVLPLENLSGDPAQEYFSDGTTEELIATLTQVRPLTVISRTSVMRYKGTHKSIPEIGRELGADVILEGSVRRAEGRVRVTAQLIDAATDAHLWAGTFDEDLSDVLKLQSDVAKAIADKIQLQLSPAVAARLDRTPSINAGAHDEVLVGNYYRWRGDDPSLRQAVEHYRQALRLQPDYAPAYAGLSLVWNLLNDEEAAAAARDAAIKAVQLDPELAEAHAAMGGIKGRADWDWQGAETEFRRAVDIDPGSLDSCFCYSIVLASMGRISEAEATIKQALARNPQSAPAHATHGLVLYFGRRYGEAEARLRQALELDDRSYLAHVILSGVYRSTGRLREAVNELNGPEFQNSALLAASYARAGNRPEALRILETLTAPGHKPERRGIAYLYAALGDKTHALEWLAASLDSHENRAHMVIDPIFDDLRGDRRFAELVARLHFPPDYEKFFESRAAR